MKRGLLLFSLFFIFFVVCSVSQASVYINEVMPNPVDNCSDCTEWIELYSEKPINLSGFVIDTNDSKNTTLNFSIEDYFIITRNKTEFLKNWQISPDIVFESKNISLKNSGDYIGLFNLSIINETIYPSISDNLSWNRLENLTFVFCNQSTPGLKNLCEQNTTSQNNDSNGTENQTENNLTKEDNQSNQEDSSIKISDSPNKAKFGQEIDIELEIYKGSTNKYALYIYVEDEAKNKVSEKKTLHLRTKYQDYNEQVSLALKCLNESGNYKIVAEGLDDKDTESISLTSCYENSIKNEKTNENTKTLNLAQQPISNQQHIPNYPATQNSPITGSVISSNPNSSPIILPIVLGFIIVLMILAVIYQKR